MLGVTLGRSILKHQFQTLVLSLEDYGWIYSLKMLYKKMLKHPLFLNGGVYMGIVITCETLGSYLNLRFKKMMAVP